MGNFGHICVCQIFFVPLQPNLKNMLHWPHEPYYRDRWTEEDLCNDFPGDKILIHGLHAMQAHFWTHNVNIDIPVVQVMNTVHYLAAYMFATTCSGDQLEYDVMAHNSVGNDKQLMLVTMIVLAAMLKRTEGFRAKQCRNVLLENRSEDFYEGVTLYDRFLNSAEEHFAEEEFLLDTHKQIQQLTEENKQLTSEIIQLRYTITKMEKQQNSQFNAPIYLGCTFSTTNTTNNTNNYYATPVTSSDEPQEKSWRDILGIPKPNRYSEVRRHILERLRFDDEFREFYADATRVELCQRLSKEFGWYLDPNSLGKNMNRKH